jgi:methylenetetrahydrofolate reductase (NADPH)
VTDADRGAAPGASRIDPGLGPLAAALAAGRFAVTAELRTIDAADPAAVAAAVEPLRGVVDGVACTDNTGANPHLSPLATARLVADVSVEPIMQLSCRDRNRIALQSDLLGAGALGIRTVLLMGGDLVTAGDHPEAKAVFDLDAGGLLAAARTLRDDGTYLSGRRVDPAPRWLIGAVENPFAAPVEERPARLAAKVKAGAEFIVTQVGFDLEILRRFCETVASRDAAVGAPLLVSVFVPRSVRNLEWLRDRVAGVGVPEGVVARLAAVPADGQAVEGQRMAIEIAAAVRDLPGVAGVHLIGTGDASPVAAVARRVRPA